MKKQLRTVALILALSCFTGFAVASGSSSDSDTETTTTTAEETTTTTTESDPLADAFTTEYTVQAATFKLSDSAEADEDFGKNTYMYKDINANTKIFFVKFEEGITEDDIPNATQTLYNSLIEDDNCSEASGKFDDVKCDGQTASEIDFYATNGSYGTLTVIYVNESGIAVFLMLDMTGDEENFKEYHDAFMDNLEIDEDYDWSEYVSSDSEETDADVEETEAEEEESDGDTLADDVIRDDFKEFWDSYEEFYDTYIEFMQSYDEMDLTMLTKYAELTAKELEIAEKAEKWDDEETTPAEDAYMLEVMNRVNKKMMDANLALATS